MAFRKPDYRFFLTGCPLRAILALSGGSAFLECRLLLRRAPSFFSFFMQRPAVFPFFSVGRFFVEFFLDIRDGVCYKQDRFLMMHVFINDNFTSSLRGAGL